MVPGLNLEKFNLNVNFQKKKNLVKVDGPRPEFREIQLKNQFSKIFFKF